MRGSWVRVPARSPGKSIQINTLEKHSGRKWSPALRDHFFVLTYFAGHRPSYSGSVSLFLSRSLSTTPKQNPPAGAGFAGGFCDCVAWGSNSSGRFRLGRVFLSLALSARLDEQNDTVPKGRTGPDCNRAWFGSRWSTCFDTVRRSSGRSDAQYPTAFCPTPCVGRRYLPQAE